MRQLKTNCPNCAAPLIHGKCEYCGTKVQYANEIDILFNDWNTEPIELSLNLKKGSDTYILPLRGHIDNITISSDSADITDIRGIVVKRIATNQNVDFTFSGSLMKEVN